MPLDVDAPDELGVDYFCERCNLCTTSCPPQAIFDTKQLVRGEHKWYADFDKCLPYFVDTYGCAACIASCPWIRAGSSSILARKMAKKLKHK